MPHSAKGGNFLLPRRSRMDSLEHVPVFGLSCLKFVTLIKVSGAFLKAWDTIISCNHRSEFLLLVLPLLSSALYHPLLSCSSLVLNSLLKAPWWFLFWSFWFFSSESVPGDRIWVLKRDRCALQNNSSEI